MENREEELKELRLKELRLKEQYNDHDFLKAVLTETPEQCDTRISEMRAVIVALNLETERKRPQVSAADKRVCNPKYLVLPPRKLKILDAELKDSGLTRASISWHHVCYYHNGRTKYKALHHLECSTYHQHAWEKLRTGSGWEKPSEIVAIRNALDSARKKALPSKGFIYDTGAPSDKCSSRYAYVGTEPRRTWLFVEGIGAVFKPVTTREIRTLTAVHSMHSRYPIPAVSNDIN